MCCCCFPPEHPLGCGFQKVGVHDTLVITGVCYTPTKYITSGKSCILPFQVGGWLDNNVYTLEIPSYNILTCHAVPITVISTAAVQLGGSQELLENAAEKLLSWSLPDLKHMLTELIEGHQRGAISTMDIQQVISDKALLQDRLISFVKKDLQKLGVNLVSFTIKEVEDDNGVLLDLGAVRLAQQKSQARIGVALNEAEAAESTYRSKEQETVEVYQQMERQLTAQRENILQDMANLLQNAPRQADSDFADPLQSAIREQDIMRANMETHIVEAKQRVFNAEQLVHETNRKLKSSVYNQADADLNTLKSKVSANVKQITLKSEAAADVIKERSSAGAYSIKQKGLAESENLSKKAEAWEKYGQAAVYDMIYDSVPAVASEVRHNLDKVDKITFVTDKSDVNRVTRDVSSIVNSLPSLVDEFCHLDLHDAVNKAVIERKDAKVTML